MDVLIGIDLGTTVLKAAAFDGRSGAALAQAAIRLPVRSVADGTREQDPAAVDAALTETLRTLRRRLGARWAGVRGLGLAAQGGSAVIVRRATGHPLTPLYLWNDTRAYPLLPAIAARKPAGYWRTLARREGPGAGLARLAWLRRRQPQLLSPANLYAGAGEYLYFRLTGLWRQDAGNALQIGCYRVARRDLDQGPLDLVGVDKSFFAPMRCGHERHPLSRAAAERFGLSPEVLVAGPYMDHEAGYLSALGAGARPLQCSLGTAWVANFVLPDDSPGASPFQLVLPSPVGTGRLVVQPLLTGNVTWDWALAAFVHPDHRTALSRLDGIFADDLLPPPGLTALPWLTQPNPLDATAMGGGAFVGLGPHTTSAEMLRAVAAGMAGEMARVMTEVVSSGAVDSVVLGGGAGKGRFFRELLATLFAPLPVYAQVDEDLSGPRGAVFALSRAAAKARTRRVSLLPREVRRRIARAYEMYLQVFGRLGGQVKVGEPFHCGERKRKKR
jgi:sugar (pentulose or hexulose) kinase